MPKHPRAACPRAPTNPSKSGRPASTAYGLHPVLHMQITVYLITVYLITVYFIALYLYTAV